MAGEFVKTLFTMLIVIDPVGLVPVFLSLTSGFDDKKRLGTLLTAVIAAFFILCLFILAGAPLLAFLGISPGAFYVSGGILLLLMSIDMLYGKARRSSDANEEEKAAESANVAIFPLAIPMLSGPGAITTIMLYMSSGNSPVSTGAILIASVLISLSLAAAAMLASKAIFKLIGKIGVTVLERIMGLLLSGLAVQFVYRGLSLLGAIKS
jgi:multiple antibiotic resistance protein